MAGPLLIGIPSAAGGPDAVSEDSPQPGSHGVKARIPPIDLVRKFRLLMAPPSDERIRMCQISSRRPISRRWKPAWSIKERLHLPKP